LPPQEWEAWFNFRKTEHTNKTIKEDIRKACQEFDAALFNGKAWINKTQWRKVAGHFKAVSEALGNLQVCFLLLAFVSIQ
jgi:hypothetical protein